MGGSASLQEWGRRTDSGRCGDTHVSKVRSDNPVSVHVGGKNSGQPTRVGKRCTLPLEVIPPYVSAEIADTQRGAPITGASQHRRHMGSSN